MTDKVQASQIHRRVDVTGYTIVSRNWRVFSRGTVNLPAIGLGATLAFKLVTDDDFKGVKELHGRTGILITLASQEERSIHLLITGPLTSDGSISFMSFDDLKVFIMREYYGAMIKALEGVDDWILLRLLRRYEIQPSEVGIFGDLLQEHLNQQLQDFGLSSVLLICSMEHVSSWGIGVNINGDDGFRSYHLAYADQVIVNFTQTFYKTDTCLLWKASSILGCYPGEITEFYNFLTGGHGSFLIDFKTQPDYARKLDAAGVHLHSLKFTTDFFINDVDPTSRAIWQQADLQQSLTAFPGMSYDGVPAGGMPVELSKIMQCLNTTSDYCSHVENYATSRNSRDKCFGAKFTAILRYVPKGSSTPYVTSNGEILRSMYNKFEEDHPGQNIISKMAEFPMSDMANQVKSTLLMAVNTMEPVIQDAILTRSNEPIRLSLIPNIRSLQNVLVCEAILSFCIYGRMNVFSNGKLFAAPFYETLGLVPETFRNRTAAFEGLRALRYIIVTGETLSYVGPFFGTTYVLQNGTEKNVKKDDPINRR